MKNLFSGLIGMGVGVAVGVFAMQYATSAKGRKMRRDIMRVVREKEHDAEEVVGKARDRAMRFGAKVADRVSQGAHEMTNKVDHLKEQLHSVETE